VVKEIALPNGRIRNIENISPEEFPSLRYVNLDNNQLTSVTSLRNFPLLSLRVNGNKIEKLSEDSGDSDNTASPRHKKKDRLFQTLQTLQLGHNLIKEITFLHLNSFVNLTHLNLEGNDIQRVSNFIPEFFIMVS
jgi:Leucine-rich repeat (LRR) protein